MPWIINKQYAIMQMESYVLGGMNQRHDAGKSIFGLLSLFLLDLTIALISNNTIQENI